MYEVYQVIENEELTSLTGEMRAKTYRKIRSALEYAHKINEEASNYTFMLGEGCSFATYVINLETNEIVEVLTKK